LQKKLQQGERNFVAKMAFVLNEISALTERLKSYVSGSQTGNTWLTNGQIFNFREKICSRKENLRIEKP